MSKSEAAKAKARAYYVQNRDAAIARATRWAKAHPDRKRANNRASYERNIGTAKAQKKAWREANRDRLLAEDRARYWENREQRLQRARLQRTGFTEELRRARIEEQNGRCAICSTDLSALPDKHIHADHCHKRNLPRGVLCHACNAGLGFFKDDPEILATAIEYLKAHAA